MMRKILQTINQCKKKKKKCHWDDVPITLFKIHTKQTQQNFQIKTETNNFNV
jgi:hypothetical protein